MLGTRGTDRLDSSPSEVPSVALGHDTPHRNMDPVATAQKIMELFARGPRLIDYPVDVAQHMEPQPTPPEQYNQASRQQPQSSWEHANKERLKQYDKHAAIRS